MPHAIGARPESLTPSIHPKLGVKSRHQGLHRCALHRIFRPYLEEAVLTRILRRPQHISINILYIQVYFQKIHVKIREYSKNEYSLTVYYTNHCSTKSLWVITISISFNSSLVKNRTSRDSALMVMFGSCSNSKV